jgi:N-acetylneuraminic acid mutarotase
MSRDTLLRQQKEKDDAIKEAMQKYKDPSSIKYDLCDEAGINAGYMEYQPNNDTVYIRTNGEVTSIEGKVLKSLRDVLNKLLDE